VASGCNGAVDLIAEVCCPWLWIGLTSLPALLFLSHGYLAAAPRTLMLSSVGIAWAMDGCLRTAGRSAREDPGAGAVAALLIGLLLQNTLFIQAQLRFFQLAVASSGKRWRDRGR